MAKRADVPKSEQAARCLSSDSFWGRAPKTVLLLGVLVLILIGLRVYKAHQAGILHDEYWTTRDYCKNIQSPMTVYTSTNNHILNSLSIVLMRPAFGRYEHYIRIHTVLWGAFFCVGIAWTLRNVLRSSVLRIVFLLLILLNWFIFDLSYLARGYAMAMGIMFITIAAYAHNLSKEDRRGLDGWPVTILFIAMNFIAMGSMLSALSMVVSLNGFYVVMLLVRARGQSRAVLTKRLFQIVTLVAGSGLSLYLLYFRVLSEVRQLSKQFETEPFFEYMKKILWDPFIKLNGMALNRMLFERHVYLLTLSLLAVCLVICLIFFLMRIKSNPSGNFRMSPATFILVLTMGVFVAKVVQFRVLGMSLGMPRNSIFFLVLVLLSGGILIDHAVGLLSRTKIISGVVHSVCIGVLGLLIYVNLPSLRAVDTRGYDWGKQSAVGPLLRYLRRIDPQHTWRLNIDGYADCLGGAIQYYQQFGYQARRVGKDAVDVYVVREYPARPHTIYLNYDYFLDFHCCVIANPGAFRDKPIFYQVSPAAEVPLRSDDEDK